MARVGAHRLNTLKGAWHCYPIVGRTVDAIDTAFRASSLPPSIVGTTDAEAVATAVREWCTEHLGADGECFRCEISVGVVFGVQLDDGRRVAVKAHSRTLADAALRTMQQAQRQLAEARFPAPRPLAGPAPLLATLAMAEEWLEGAAGDFSRPEIVSASARAFREHVEILRALPNDDLPRTIAAGWPPKPHNALFDFARDPEGAAWIDAIALRAHERLGVGGLVAGHADWSAKHVRFAADRVCATYDWDSLRRERLPVLAGFAAASHHVELDLESPWRAEPARVRAYLDELDLSGEEHETALAAAVYLFAYTARCEHGFIGVPTLTRMRETLGAAAADLLGRA